ncbi:MAG: hypothetical protein QOF89_2223 [Acidobacteriota bacterium]|nr:hypothetical protein [Acidobacteriota bacterium]
MSLTTAFAAHEARTQLRSLRFRVLAAAYVAAGAAPAAMILARRQELRVTIGGATYANEVLGVLPLLTAVVALLISLDAVTREQDEGAWSTVSLAGTSSAGYLLRRWLALQAVLLPLTAVPVAAAAVVALVGCGPGAVRAAPFLGPWLMQVVPIAAAFSALGLGVGTIAGGAINSFLLAGVALWLVPSLLNNVLVRFGIGLEGPLGWLRIGTFGSTIQRMATIYRGTDSPWAAAFPLEVSESPWDGRVAAEQYLSLAALPVALAAAALGIAVRHLRRTRPDVRPWRIRPDHPLRTFLTSVARLRERYTPDPRPSRPDLLVLGLALLAATGVVGLLVERAEHYERLGRERFDAEEWGGPAPTPAGVVPGRWRIEGRLGRTVDLRVTAEMRNGSAEPQAHLAFMLNPFVRVEAAQAKEGTAALSRRWDRLAVELVPPIPPGGVREVRFRLHGEPAEIESYLSGRTFWGFHKLFGGHLQAAFGRDLADLSKSYRVPSVSPRRIDLAATDLTPVPRYRTWKLAPGEEVPSDVFVPEEVFRPVADLSLELAVPPGAFVADACGDSALRGRLAGRCRLPLAELAVAGGSLRALPQQNGGATVAVYPLHAAQGELHLGFLTRGDRRLEEAWPGLGGLRRTVVLERPPEAAFSLDEALFTFSRRWQDPAGVQVQVQGELVRVNEMDLIQLEGFKKPDLLVADLVAGRLSRRRAVAPEDAILFRNLLRNLVLQRLGLGPDGGAVVAVPTGREVFIRIPPPVERYSQTYWDKRFPALVAALRYRMGEEAVRAALEEVLSSPASRPATRQELYATLARHSEAPLDRFIQDFFVQGHLPEPVLDGVEFRHSGGTEGGWRVSGKMLNLSQGEALCKIVLTTDLGRQEALVRAGGDQPGDHPGDFSFSTPHRPQAVLLDPGRECHRLVSGAVPRDRVAFDGRGQ